MGCINNPFEGKCHEWNGVEDDNLGTDKEGNCICEEDENPYDSCLYYENDDPWGEEEKEDEYE